MQKSSLAVLAFASLSVSLVSNAAADNTPTLQQVQQVQLQAEIPLACSGSGASDVRSENHSIKNTLSKSIPKGFVLRWRSSTGKSGTVQLTADLAPGQSIDVIQPGSTNAYTCTAGFFPGNADLFVKSVKWTSATTAQVEIGNTNPFEGASSSLLKVQSIFCPAETVQTVSVTVPAIDKGGSKTVDLQIAKGTNVDYLLATANATSSVPESNKSNNIGRSAEFNQIARCHL